MRSNSNSFVLSFNKMKVISLLVIFVFLVAAQCCTVTPTPTVTDPADWSKRLKATDVDCNGHSKITFNLVGLIPSTCSSAANNSYRVEDSTYHTARCCIGFKYSFLKEGHYGQGLLC